MISSRVLKDELSLTYAFLGNRIRSYLIIDLFVGFLWFGIESSFIFVLQGFLVSISLLDKSVALLPSWYPTHFLTNLFILSSFGLLRTLLTMAKNYLSIFSSQAFVREKRQAILSKALLSRNEVSHVEIVTTFNETVAHASNYVVHLNQFVHGLVVTGLFTLICLKVALFESLAGICLLAVLLVPFKRFAKNVNDHGDDLHHSWKIAHGTLINGLKNVFFLRLHGMLDSEVRRGSEALSDYERSYHNYALASSFVLGLPQLMGMLVLCLVAWASKTYFGSSPGVLLSFFYLFIRFAQSASQTNNSLSYLKLTKKGFVTLQEVLNTMGQESVRTEDHYLPKQPEITFKVEGLSGGFPNKRTLFENLNFTLHKSQLLLVKGPSGVGKSTLLRTLLGETRPLKGSILCNGSEGIDPTSLSQSIGYVGPEPFLIYGSVRDNLLYGNPNKTISDQELWGALNNVGLEQEVRKYPKQLEEVLLDETQMSSGQKQRLSMARALLRKPSLLVLDEATANIDSETEDKIIQIIKNLKPTMTTFVISHKNTFDFMADKIISLGTSSESNIGPVA